RARRGGRLLVALGDMKELGGLSESAHRAIGALVGDVAPALFVATGVEMARAADEAEARGVPVVRVATSAEAARHLEAHVRPGDLVLAKGSRSMGMEAVVSILVSGAE